MQRFLRMTGRHMMPHILLQLHHPLPAAPLLKAVIGGLASNVSNLCCVGLCAPFSSAIAADADLPAALVSLLEPFVAGAAAVLR